MITDKNNTAEFFQNFYKGIDKGLVNMGRKLRDDIKDITPVITGNLKRGMKYERISGNQVSVTNDVEYSQYVELGTVKMSPRAMMRNGFDNNVISLENEFIKTLNSFLK